ncbi:hypothetical protein BUALT_Bualt19G0023500 [Buddleja alternifolia]|uniref:Fungal lipase-type domain-containing protein n=1 Tax=Buddleja alternifolia TaxID=168488 RepID=A0AAV6W4S3_9LAMI|nr:hypothetical protein BUALT_Bualt19G0023500 [Buddleja alternifolia]
MHSTRTTNTVWPRTSPNPTTPHPLGLYKINTKSNKNLNLITQTHIKHLSINSKLINSRSTIPRAHNLDRLWMKYQGVKNWEGLLDPLDDNLRQEIIRYGRFVQSAYRSCDFDQSSSTYATCRYPKRKLLDESGFLGSGYRVTKNLIASSGIQIPKWVELGPSWMGKISSWIGYIAVCQDRNEIFRLGRRDVVIAFRGTATCPEWLENLRANLTPLPGSNPDLDQDPDSISGSGPMVESGFLSLYTSSSKNRQSLQRIVREEIRKILKKYRDEQLSFTVTGHSLGAALAILAAYDIKKTFKTSAMVTVISFAGPRVGNWSFRCCLEEHDIKILRIVNDDDPITRVPGFNIADENNENDDIIRDNSTAAAVGKLRRWVRKLVEDMRWEYADVGCELRLSSRDSNAGVNVAACHDLKTYLHLVDGFVSSNCPFRSTARQMMN